jgi:hypothetical protein
MGDNKNNIIAFYLALKGVQVEDEELLITIIDSVETTGHYYLFNNAAERNEFEELIVNLTKKFADKIGWQNVHFPSLSPSLQSVLSHIKRHCNTGKLPEWAESMITFENERFTKWKKFFRTALIQERECVKSLTDWDFYHNENSSSSSSSPQNINNNNNNDDYSSNNNDHHYALLPNIKNRESKSNTENKDNYHSGDSKKHYDEVIIIKNYSNPYLIFFLKMMEIFEEKYNTDLLLVFRQCAMRQFAYSIPSLSLLVYIHKISKKIFEIGAGSGYWAKMLQTVGCDVIACDDFSDGLEQSYFNVVNQNADQLLEDAKGKYDDYALLFCWPRSYPGYRYWKGDIVIVICEENVSGFFS